MEFFFGQKIFFLLNFSSSLRQQLKFEFLAFPSGGHVRELWTLLCLPENVYWPQRCLQTYRQTTVVHRVVTNSGSCSLSDPNADRKSYSQCLPNVGTQVLCRISYRLPSSGKLDALHKRLVCRGTGLRETRWQPRETKGKVHLSTAPWSQVKWNPAPQSYK